LKASYDTELKTITDRVGEAKALLVVPRDPEKQDSGAAGGQGLAQQDQSDGTQTTTNKPNPVSSTVENMQRIVSALAKITKGCESTFGTNRAELLAKDLDDRVTALLSQSRDRNQNLEAMKLSQDTFVASILKLIKGAYPATNTTPQLENNGGEKKNDIEDVNKKHIEQEDPQNEDVKQEGPKEEDDKKKIDTLEDVIPQLQALLDYLAGTRSRFVAEILRIIRAAPGHSTTQTQDTEAIATQELDDLVEALKRVQAEVSDAKAALKTANGTSTDNTTSSTSLSDGIKALGETLSLKLGEIGTLNETVNSLKGTITLLN
jgi:hypothetical protein